MDGVLIASGERFQNNAVLLWFCVDGRSIRVKKYAVSKIFEFVWTEPKPCLVPVRLLPRPSQSMHFGEKFLGPRDPKRIGRAQ